MAKNILIKTNLRKNQLIKLVITQALIALYGNNSNEISVEGGWAKLQEVMGCCNVSNTYGLPDIPQGPGNPISINLFKECIKIMKEQGLVYDISVPPSRATERNSDGSSGRRGLALVFPNGILRARKLYEECIWQRN